MSYQTESDVTTSNELAVYTGRVKWFNNKAGYGFITVCDGEHAGKDIFVHYSAISSENSSQYKYLVQGEYVDFSITKPENSDHEYHAVAVSGVKGGNLMCETRRENISAASARKTVTPSTTHSVSAAIEKAITSNTKAARPKTAAAGGGQKSFTEGKRIRRVRDEGQTISVPKPVVITDNDGNKVIGFTVEKVRI